MSGKAEEVTGVADAVDVPGATNYPVHTEEIANSNQHPLNVSSTTDGCLPSSASIINYLCLMEKGAKLTSPHTRCYPHHL